LAASQSRARAGENTSASIRATEDASRERGRREQEKKYTLLFANELGAQLRQAGYTVSYTRTSDTFVDCRTGPRLRGRRGADLLCESAFQFRVAHEFRDRRHRGVLPLAATHELHEFAGRRREYRRGQG
jgi:hypothetical protein